MKTLYLASCIDDNYAMSFSVVVRSVMDTLKDSYCVEWFVMNAGVSRRNMRKITRSAQDDRLKLSWLPLRDNYFSSIITRAHISLAAYQKILLFNALPMIVDKVVYLDADILVCRDIAELWDHSLNGNVIGAVQDLSIPFHDARIAMNNYHLAEPFIESDIGIKNYALFGIDPKAKYFNSGVMVIDLDLWRRTQVEEEVVAFILNNKQDNRCFDQDGLNAVLWDRWCELDHRWNQISFFLRYPSWERSPFDRETFEKIKNDPFIVHFVSYDKPWFWGGKHSCVPKFFEHLEKTDWKGWRPSFLGTMWKRFIYWMKNLRFRLAGFFVKRRLRLN